MRRIAILVLLFVVFNKNIYSQWELRINGLPEWGVADPLDVSSDSTLAMFVRKSEKPRPLSISNDLANSWINFITPEIRDGTDVSIFDKNNIWFCTEDGKIYHSNNGGFNWTLQYRDSINFPFFNFIKFFDKNNGIVVGDAISAQSPAIILKTTNGGNNWVLINHDYLIGEWSRDVFFPIEFPSLSVGYFYGSGYHKLYKTIDGGTSWQIVPLPTGIYKTYMIKFYDENIGMLVSDINAADDFIYRTINGGNSWTKLSLLTNTNHHDIEFLPGSPSKVWFTDYDHLFFSNDTGNTWQEVTVVSGSLEARNIEFLNDSIGFIVCDNSKFFATENNGGIIISIDNKFISFINEYNLFQNYPNPFNPSTQIQYILPSSSHVIVTVYNSLGQTVKVFNEGTKEAGNHNITFNGEGLSSGIYLYSVNSVSIDGKQNFTAAKKMLLIR
ncbi:MAG: hypothetical protein COW85_04295 [Ignavibacteria bacterium CG22_combo_CG10-13_8_21_14_all_37_15]|nr:MAG: hypothetical protein COW85_04295 [Ignavibacteria bacterium CG22_combo_CG10-13_8_21_14_all_37_15]